jgi:hypothetical protein
MRQYRLYILSFLLLLTCTFLSQDTFAKKKKKRCKKTKTTKVVKVDTTNKVIPAPGVPNKAEFDSMKNSKMNLKLQQSALVVSFISLSSGIDMNSAKSLENDIIEYRKKNECDLRFELKPWGREGERDYCIFSPDMSCLDNFAKLVKSKYGNNSKIFVKEKVECRK